MKPEIPPPQDLHDATEKAANALTDQSAEQMVWLGAEQVGERWRLPVLNDTLEVDIAAGEVTTSSGEAVRPAWRLLALHYLGVRGRPQGGQPKIVFADLAGGRPYAGVYQQRVNKRLCGTAGRDLPTLTAGAEAIGTSKAEGGDAAFDIRAFPRILTRLIWYAADDEFSASATLLLPVDIEEFFCVEDVVVLSESIVSRLSGHAF